MEKDDSKIKIAAVPLCRFDKERAAPPSNDKISRTISNGENFDPQKKIDPWKKFFKKVKSAEYPRKSGSS